MKKLKVVKKYKNGKLYLCNESRYTSLKELAQKPDLIQYTFIENSTKNVITREMLFNIAMTIPRYKNLITNTLIKDHLDLDKIF